MKICRHLSRLHNDSLKDVKLLLWNTLVHLNEARRLELREAELGDSLNNSGLGRRGEDTLDSVPGLIDNAEQRGETVNGLV